MSHYGKAKSVKKKYLVIRHNAAEGVHAKGIRVGNNSTPPATRKQECRSFWEERQERCNVRGRGQKRTKEIREQENLLGEEKIPSARRTPKEKVAARWGGVSNDPIRKKFFTRSKEPKRHLKKKTRSGGREAAQGGVKMGRLRRGKI